MKTMMPDNLGLTSKVLDLQMERQNIVMSNLANMKVPSYKAKKFEFEKELQSALGRDVRGKLSRTEGSHLPSVFSPASFEGEVAQKWKPKVTFGQDAVDLDKEMTVMAKNSLQYNALTTLVKKDFESMTRVIQEGSK